MSTRDAIRQRPLLARILDTPHLAQIVPRLQPQVLHRIIERCGLEDAGELVALATPEQLAGVFDLDLWRSPRSGQEEQFDPDRFAEWMEVLVEADVDMAARSLAGIDPGLVTAGLAQHVRVFDPAAIQPAGEGDEEEAPDSTAVNQSGSCEIGGYLIVARGAEAWDAIVAVLVALEADHPETFHRVLTGVRRLSNSAPEVDGLDDLLTEPEQILFDVGFSREQRRERDGYATPEQARAFLQMARQLNTQTGAPPTNPLAVAYFRGVDGIAPAAPEPSEQFSASDAAPAADDTASGVASLLDVLADDGVLPRPVRALLDAPSGSISRLGCMQAQLRFVHERDGAAYSMRLQELAFLSNVLLAGCSIQGRRFTLQEASDAAVAICNLGLENWPAHWLSSPSLPEDFLAGHDLVGAFQVGWRVLDERVCTYAATRLMDVLATLRCDDSDTRAGLDALRRELAKSCQAGAPWRARDALEVIMTLDSPAWVALVGLIDECPVLHAAIGATRGAGPRSIRATDFVFISENSQIALVAAFLDTLAATLRG